MDFSWLGITVIDIGIVSIGIIGFAWLFRRIAILERENGRLQAEVDALTKENRELRLEFEQQCQTLKDEFEKENGALRQDLNVLAGRYDEVKEMLTLLLKRENFIE